MRDSFFEKYKTSEVYLSAHGSAADEGELPSDRRTGENE